MILEVIRYPNKILRQVSSRVEAFDEGLHSLLDNMYETMLSRNGVGLAAIQVAVPLRVLLINIPREDGTQSKEDLLEVINPEILKSEGNLAWSEGCLSVPGFYEEVQRFQKVTLRYQDRMGEVKEGEFEDFAAVALQHEIDHLNGVLFVDKLSLLKRKKFEKELRKREREAAKA